MLLGVEGLHGWAYGEVRALHGMRFLLPLFAQKTEIRPWPVSYSREKKKRPVRGPWHRGPWHRRKRKAR